MTYPRTESTQYPASFDVRGALQAQSGHQDWGAYVQVRLGLEVERCVPRDIPRLV